MDSSARQVGTVRNKGFARQRWKAGVCALAVAAGFVLGGCSSNDKTTSNEKLAPAPRYAPLPPRENLPEFMKGTIYEMVDVQNKAPYPISGYGLVVGLAGTGNNNGAPQAVRSFMIDRMVKNGFGSRVEGTRHLQPEAMLRDPRTAIVEVYASLPPGARAGMPLDVLVQPVTGSATRSLAHGSLYQTDLTDGGVDPIQPKTSVNVYGKAQGPVFVNPVYVKPRPGESTQIESLRHGLVMNGGVVLRDRPIWLRLRTPQLSIARAIEGRIDLRFNEPPRTDPAYSARKVAVTQDEGQVNIFVPAFYRGDWEHFMGVVTHLYVNAAPGFGVTKAKELVEEAVKPNALLQDISYCWEGLGEEALPSIRTLYAHPKADVAYAAARAGAMIGDVAAEEALLTIASSDKHPFQLNAVKALGARPESVRITRMLTRLLSVENALVRVEAYRILADWGTAAILSKPVRGQFVLDFVHSDGPPLVYASRSGIPRIAIFGQDLKLNMPIMFSAMDSRLTLSTAPNGRDVLIFDRTPSAPPTGQQAITSPDLKDLLWRLGGGTREGFAFGYSDLVGILRALSDEQCIASSFMLQDMPVMQGDIEDAPPIIEPGVMPPVADTPVQDRPRSGTVVRTGIAQ